MTKIMVATSGGIDSTVLLHKLLSEGTDEIVALFLREDYLHSNTTQGDKEQTAFRAVVEWLKGNVRDFRAVEGNLVTTDPDGNAYDPKETLPIRQGFEQLQKVYWYKCRMASLAVNAKALGVDEVQEGLTVWNTRHDDHWRAACIGEYDRRTTIPRKTPWRWKDPSTGLWNGRSKLLNFRELPAALEDKVSCCTSGEYATVRCGGCSSCIARQFYDTICADLTLDQLAQVEDLLQQHGSYGAHYSRADPIHYRLGDVTDVMRDLENWKAWAETL